MSENGFLLIADISGYTEFIKLHNLAKKPVFGAALAKNFESHASTIVADLLETVIDVVEPSMRLNKLEGDAAFFFSSEKIGSTSGDLIFEVMAKANAAFNKKLSDLAFVQACGCEPCTQSKNLRLKICAHKGNFSLNTIRNFEELSGEDVILTHRMLKNDIDSSEYWLVTDAFHKTLSSKNKKKFTKITQNLESFDKVKLNFFELGSPIPRNEKVEKQSRAYNWILQAGYFASAMFKKKRAR